MNWFQYMMWLASKQNQTFPTIPPSPQAQPKPTPTAGSVFDDFDGTTINSALWEVENSVDHPDTKQGVSTATNDNVFLDGNSNLVIRAENTSSGWQTGWLTSWNKRTYGYGKFSASIKMPAGAGMDSAFWLLGANYPTTPEPNCGEVDIIEYIGNGRYYNTIHGPMYGGSPWNQTQINGSMNFDPAGDFHTYWCQHTLGRVDFGIDNTAIGTANRNTIPTGAPWVLDEAMNVLFCIVVGNGMSGQPTAATASPSQMLVDWFYWQPSS